MTPQIPQRLPNPVDFCLYLGVGVHVLLDLVAELLVWKPAKAGEEVVDVRVGEQITRHARPDRARHRSQVAAVHPGAGGAGAGAGGGSANADEAPPNSIAPASAPAPVTPTNVRRMALPDSNISSLPSSCAGRLTTTEPQPNETLLRLDNFEGLPSCRQRPTFSQISAHICRTISDTGSSSVVRKA